MTHVEHAYFGKYRKPLSSKRLRRLPVAAYADSVLKNLHFYRVPQMRYIMLNFVIHGNRKGKIFAGQSERRQEENISI